jgi:hypothetical protein
LRVALVPILAVLILALGKVCTVGKACVLVHPLDDTSQE